MKCEHFTCYNCPDEEWRIDEVRAELERRTDWYQQRFNSLREWVDEEVRPLSQEVYERYFNIVANGSPAPHEAADWTETMHGLRMRAEAAEHKLDEAKAEVERLKEWFWQIAAEANDAHPRMSTLEGCHAALKYIDLHVQSALKGEETQ